MLDRILVVDDEPIVLEVLSEVLTREGFSVSQTSDAQMAIERLSREPHELVLCDIRMPGMDGFEFLRHVHRSFPATDVVLMTGFASVDGAIDAMNMGAADYLIKPLKPKEVVARIRAILQRRRLEAELHALQSELRSRYEIHNVVAFSPRMRAVVSALRRVADQQGPVVLVGEPGSGRRFIARILHYTGARRDQPVATLDASNPFQADLEAELFGTWRNGRRVQRGQLERCKGGTLHLFDSQLMPFELQERIARALRDGAYAGVDGAVAEPLTTRLVFSFPAPVAELVDRGLLHRDLGLLCDFVTINVPPLRERSEDLGGLVSAFLEGYTADHGESLRFSPECLPLLTTQDFPGNVAELFSLLSHSARNTIDGRVTTDVVERSLRQAQMSRSKAPTAMSDHLDDREYQLVLRAVTSHPGRLDQAARELGISRTTLWRRMRKYDIKLPAPKRLAAPE